jgi:hypothetical protein
VIPPGVPKVIYALWLQGKDEAPGVVALNFARWRELNSDYRLRILDRRAAEALLLESNLPIAGLPPQALSDLVRARLLLDEGGIWVDASVFPVKPLDAWLPDNLTEAGFFAFERPGPDRPISSWFLAATPHNPILRAWWQEIKRFWSKPRGLMAGIPDDAIACVSPARAAANDEYPYFWLHYLFQYLLDTHVEVAALWSTCMKVSADPPHRLQLLFANNQTPSAAEIREAANAAPVQKLNWRISYPLDVLASLT